FTVPVSISDGRWTNVTDLDVSITLSDQSLADLHSKLLSPTLATSSVPIVASSSVQAAPAPTTTSFAGGAGLSNVDGFYNGMTLSFTTGPDMCQSRTVATYTGSTKVFTFSTAFGAAPAAN